MSHSYNMAEDDKFREPEFLGWALLTKLKFQSDDQVSRSKFLKLICIADRRLQESENINVGLPRYWYMYGELVNEHEFAGRFYNAPKAIGWEGQRYIPKNLEFDDFDISEELIGEILPIVEEVVSDLGRENVEDIKEYQYTEFAENEFIRKYGNLRWILKNIDLGKQIRLEYFEQGLSNEQYVKGHLDGMMENYPEDESGFDEMRPLYLKWDDTIRLMLEQSVEYSKIAEFLDEFIGVLSKSVLRLKYHQNISSERLSRWEEEGKDAQIDFRTEIEDERKRLFDSRSKSKELDKVSDTYSAAIAEKIDNLLAAK